MNVSYNSLRHSVRAIAVLLLLLLSSALWPQVAAQKPDAAEAKPEPPKDTLGRDTPKGTVLGFLSAARKGNDGIAALYLNTRLRGADAADLAHQLVVVLDRRLPARLNELSDKPEGSLPDPSWPDEDLVGTINTDHGQLQILIERVYLGKAGKVWLFSSKTLQAIPDVFQELTQSLHHIVAFQPLPPFDRQAFPGEERKRRKDSPTACTWSGMGVRFRHLHDVHNTQQQLFLNFKKIIPVTGKHVGENIDVKRKSA
jgi:hypothetical protein